MMDVHHSLRSHAIAMLPALMALSVVGAGTLAGAAEVSAGEAADIAYVDIAKGPIIALAQGRPVLLNELDIIPEGARLDLPAKSELTICHYPTQRYLTLRGPARAFAFVKGLTVESGRAAEVSVATCEPPVVSKSQGGLVVRGMQAPDVSLQTRVKVINRGRVPAH
ncbi:MAG: hypothetical protein ACJ8F3_00250 [Xanthobacteraceae bacterium]